MLYKKYNKMRILSGIKMDNNYIKYGEITILTPFKEEDILKPLWDKGFETCLIDSRSDSVTYLIMTKIQ